MMHEGCGAASAWSSTWVRVRVRVRVRRATDVPLAEPPGEYHGRACWWKRLSASETHSPPARKHLVRVRVRARVRVWVWVGVRVRVRVWG